MTFTVRDAYGADIERFIGPAQLRCICELLDGEEGDYFHNKLLELANLFRTMPKTHENREQDAVVYLHYFVHGSDWWICERDKGDPKDPRDDGQQHQAWGYVCLNGDVEMAECGYISIVELMENNVELDLHWKPVLASSARNY